MGRKEDGMLGWNFSLIKYILNKLIGERSKIIEVTCCANGAGFVYQRVISPPDVKPDKDLIS